MRVQLNKNLRKINIFSYEPPMAHRKHPPSGCASPTHGHLPQIRRGSPQVGGLSLLVKTAQFDGKYKQFSEKILAD